MSLSAAAFALDSRFGTMRLPRLRRMEVGRSNLISLENVLSLLEGFREVVTRGRGSASPDSIEYSSSMVR